MVGRDSYIAVYMLASRKHGTLYIGVTSRLTDRIYEHREGAIPGFTHKYGVKRLVWYEKAMKKWRREWKINLIERENPNWDDLYGSLA